jgi:hypothetical protein
VIVTISEQIRCAQRELSLRERVYPRWVSDRRMTQDKADREIAGMRAVIATLEHVRALIDDVANLDTTGDDDGHGTYHA